MESPESTSRSGGASYARLVDEIRRVGLTYDQLGGLTGVRGRQVQNGTAGTSKPSGESRDRLIDVYYIVQQLEQVYLPEGVEIWLHAKNRAFDGRRPIELLHADEFELSSTRSSASQPEPHDLTRPGGCSGTPSAGRHRRPTGPAREANSSGPIASMPSIRHRYGLDARRGRRSAQIQHPETLAVSPRPPAADSRASDIRIQIVSQSLLCESWRVPSTRCPGQGATPDY